MNGNVFTQVKNCSEADSLALVYYLYNVCNELTDLEAHEELQVLFNALVKRLDLEKHCEKVLEAMLDKQIKLKKLTPFKVHEKYCHPFDMKGVLKLNLREDSDIYDCCGSWKTNSLRNINLIRLLFGTKAVDFQKIIEYTFFKSPEEFSASSITARVNIPKSIKDAVKDISKVEFAKKCLKLSEQEAEFLMAAFRILGIKEMYSICNDLFRSSDMSREDIYALCMDIPIKSIKAILRNDQKLRSYGLFNEEGDMDNDAIDAINEQDLKVYFADIIKNEKNTKAYNLNSFSVKKEKAQLALEFLKSNSPCNILLYGVPGSGKTEFAKALIKNSGLKMTVYRNELEIKNKDEEEAGPALNRLNCYLSLKKEDSILIVDEAETVLKSVGSFFGMKYSLPQKGTINNMLENSENKVIWILNYTDELDESTLRRFTYSIKFHEMPKTTLRGIAEEKFSKINMPLALKSQILDMCGQYRITGASVENIAKAVKAMECSAGNESKVIANVKDVLEANSTLIFGKKKMRDSVGDSYDLSVLNTSTPALEIVEMIENAVQWNEENRSNQSGIRMLFYGLSGTGKTELVRYISEKIGKKIILKRASDILDKYVGASERKIREAFEEAEETDSILLFDEADTFFANRESAVASWERSQVNEFLTQMEEFSGILICTTNLRKIMDPAMQRRFHILTEFKPLNMYGTKKLLTTYFGKYQFEDTQIAELVRSDSVTPGDFGALDGRIRFVSRDKINSEYIMQELLNMQKEKKLNGGGRIGFAS